MLVRLLGTAAGGGQPQWNCGCRNCAAARAGAIPARTQSSVAISVDGRSWFVVNASPDLRAQIEASPALQPQGAARHSPIAAVLLTNADLDHTLGLFLLREGGAVEVHATDEVRLTLATGLRLEQVLASYGGTRWVEPPVELLPLAPGLRYRAIWLPGNAPRYAPDGAQRQSLAYEFQEEQSGRTLLVAPDVAAITPDLQAAMEQAALVLFDGTFWSETELREIDPQARLASEMGHLPIATGSLPVLRGLTGRRVLVHINNSNPVLQPDSPERLELQKAGVEVGEDGWEIEL